MNRELTREELYEKVWSAPTTQVAAELGISDVALAKRCKKLNVPKPSLGYWAKAAAAQKPKKVPLPARPQPVKFEPLSTPIPKSLPLPGETEDLHPVAVELRVALRDGAVDSNQCVKAEERTIPRVTVSKPMIDRTAKTLHVILTAVEERGIPFRKSRSKYDGAYFEKGNDRMNLAIEEFLVEREPTAQEKRRSGWQWQKPKQPTGKLIFTLNPERYGSRTERKWTENDKLPLEDILSQIVQAICKHYVDMEKERAEAAERSRKQHEEWLIQQEAERKQQHTATLEATAHTRAEDLLKRQNGLGFTGPPWISSMHASNVGRRRRPVKSQLHSRPGLHGRGRSQKECHRLNRAIQTQQRTVRSIQPPFLWEVLTLPNVIFLVHQRCLKFLHRVNPVAIPAATRPNQSNNSLFG